MQFPGRFATEFLEAFAESASIQRVFRASLSLMIVSLVRKNHLFKEMVLRLSLSIFPEPDPPLNIQTIHSFLGTLYLFDV